MKNTKNLLLCLLFTLFSFLTACGTTTDPAESYRDETAQQIFDRAEASTRSKDYKEAIKRYEALDAQYPFGHNAEVAQLHIIYAYYMNGDYPLAESAADRFIHSHPTSPHVDYAYYMRGLSNYYQNMGLFEKMFSVDFATRDLTQIKKSFNDFSELVNKYPDSYYTPAAYQYMVYLRNVLANHQLEVAQYYYSRKAYVASANRASLVVQYYEGAPAVPDALVMMAKSYHQLHMTALENQIIEVIRYNYPNSVYLQEVTGEKPVAAAPVTPVASANTVVAPKQSVVASNQSVQDVPVNGMRSSHPILIGDAVRSLNSAYQARHQTQANSAPADSLDVTPPGFDQTPPKQVVAADKTVVAPKEKVVQQAEAKQVRSPTGNGGRDSQPIGLGDMLSSLGKSPLFALHGKNAEAQAGTDQQGEQVAEAKQPPLVYPGNGSR